MKVKGGANTPKVADVPVACFADGGDLMSEGKVRVENETQVAGMADRLDSGIVELKARLGLLILESWMGLPKMRNSVFVGLRESRLADIQPEIWEIDDWRS